MEVKISYFKWSLDPDILRLRIIDGPVHFSVEIIPNVFIWYDQQNNIMGLEIKDFSDGYFENKPVFNRTGIPQELLDCLDGISPWHLH